MVRNRDNSNKSNSKNASRSQRSKSNKSNNSTQKPKKKRVKVNYKKSLLMALKIALIAGVLLVILGGSAAFGMFVASLQDVPEFDPAELESTLPSKIKDKDGEMIVRLDREQHRETITLDEVPQHVIEAFLAIEDSNFYDHLGFDIRGIGRAAVVNFRETGSPFGGLHGGSTITQQLVKNSFLSPEQSVQRKIQEVWLALQVERAYTKEEILELYLNNAVYFNHNAYGIQAASEVYFNKDVSELEIEEAALLAGIIRHPSRLSPYENPEAAKQRQELVLRSMENQDFIDEREFNEAKNEPLEELLAELEKRKFPHPHYVDYVINEEVIPILKSEMEEDDESFDAHSEAEQMLYHGGLTIYTNLDRDLQTHVEEVMGNDENYPMTQVGENGIKQPQSAAIVTEPDTGEIRSLFGGRGYDIENMSNRAVSNSINPGSALKPITVYGAAFEEGEMSPGSVVDDAPKAWDDAGGYYTPENFSRAFRGLITVREALVHSLNVPAVKVFEDIGKDVGIEYGQKLGLNTLTSGNKDNLSSAIGGGVDVNPLEMAKSYGVYANEGIKVEPYAVSRIENSRNEVVFEANPSREEVVSHETSWLITDILQDVVSHGTASGLNVDRPAAAKTGTSQNSRDGWLVTYTPDSVISIWMGFDSGGEFIPSATSYPVSMTNQIFEKVHEGIEQSNFNRPSNIEGPIEISSKSGKRPSDLTPEDYITSDYFVRNNVPTDECDAFVEKKICTESEQLATDYCPSNTVEEEVFLKREDDYEVTDERWAPESAGRRPWDHELEPPEDECEIHEDGPNRPVGLSLVLTDDDKPEISWLPPFGEDIQGYNVYRRTPEDDEFTQLNDDPIEETTFIDEDAEVGENNLYMIRTVDTDGIESADSSIISVDEEGEDPEVDEDLEEELDDKEKELEDLEESDEEESDDDDNDGNDNDNDDGGDGDGDDDNDED